MLQSWSSSRSRSAISGSCSSWRATATAPARADAAAPADLSALARDLLHVVDVLRLGRARLAHRLRFPDDLYRPGADDRRSATPLILRDRAARQGAEHHLDRRLHRRALRQAARRWRRSSRSIAVIGSIPYIALQLKAVSSSLGAILAHADVATGASRSRCSATSRCSSRSRWRRSRCCSAPATSTRPSTRTA